MAKTCGRCGVIKTLGDFYKNPSARDGLTGACRGCTKAAVKRDTQHRAAITPLATEKVCSGCKSCFPALEFHKNKAVPGGLAAYCKACMVGVCKRLTETRRKASAKSRNSNPVRVAAGRKRYYDRNREQRVENALRWQRENKGLVNAKVGLRRTAKLRATPPWADLDFIELLYVEVAALSALLVRGKLHVDHIVPLKSTRVCGLHVQDNLQALPAAVNLTKSNRVWPDMF